MKIRTMRAALRRGAAGVIAVCLAVVLLTLAGAAEGEETGVAGGADILTAVSAPMSERTGTAAAGTPVSYGLRVLAARGELVFSGLCGNELTFDAESVCRAMNMSVGSLSHVTLTTLPEPDRGTLFVGASGAAVGESIPAASLSLLSFVPADADAPCTAHLSFTVNDGGYPLSVRLCLVPAVNYTPTLALAPALSLEALTCTDLPVTGALSAYDPEGDALTYEIVGYAAHGRVTLTDAALGAYTYTPDVGYTGRDAFTYVVRDEYGNYSTSAEVSVTVAAPPAGVSYADLDGRACAAAALRVSADGIMNGTRAGGVDYFRPDAPMTRAAFLVTVMDAAGITPEPEAEPSGLADADNIPAAMRPYVALAQEKGIITGRASGSVRVFGPEETITRAEAAVILSNVIGYAKDTTVTAFADADALPAWSVPALTSLRSLGLLAPTDNRARADETLTRGEAAVWLDGMMRLIAK